MLCSHINVSLSLKINKLFVKKGVVASTSVSRLPEFGVELFELVSCLG